MAVEIGMDTRDPLKDWSKDNFLRELEKTRQNIIPKMKVALVREGAIFQKANEFAAGYDLKAFNMTIEDGYIKFMLGVKTELPKGWYFELKHRSSNSKFDILLANTVGTIDSDFRGEWQARVKVVMQPQLFVGKDSNSTEVMSQSTIATQYVNLWKEGEIALQAILHKEPEHQVIFIDESELSNTQRGEGGHGSTGDGLQPNGDNLIDGKIINQ